MKIINILASILLISVGVLIIIDKKFINKGITVDLSSPWLHWSAGFMFISFGIGAFYLFLKE